MGSRERKRIERNKRKRRAAARGARAAETGEAAAAEADAQAGRTNGGAYEAVQPPAGEVSFSERMAERSEQRNAEVRAGLEPLAAGERPRAVSVAAIVSAALAVVFTASAVVASVGGIEVDGSEPAPAPLVAVAAVLWLMTYGLFKARYWAVLGFQMLLLLVILSSALGLVQVATVPQVIASLLLLGGAGALFYFMIRAMARIQMPDRPGER